MTHSTDTTDTAVAQRHLLEALGYLHRRAHGIEGLLIGLPVAIELAKSQNMPELAAVYCALGELTEAVHAELEGVS